MEFADEKMAAALAARDPSSMRVRDRVAAAVKLRLEAHGTEREAIRRALTYLAQPQHGPLALRCLYRTVDTIWYAAGDTATDFNFYTKRALLAGVGSKPAAFAALTAPRISTRSGSFVFPPSRKCAARKVFPSCSQRFSPTMLLS